MTEFVINKTIRIVTTFSHPATVSGEEIPVISYDLFYPAYERMPFMTGVLEGNNRQVIKCKVSGEFIQGYLMTIVNEEEMVLLGDLFYGASSNKALQSHFEGTIAIYPLTAKHTPIRPFPDPDNPADDLAPEISISAPLFPYVDVQPWPAAGKASGLWQFFTYDPAGTPADSLYQQLLPLAHKDRPGMEALALQFLQGTLKTTGPYFGSLDNVPAPFNLFPAIYDELWNTGIRPRSEELLPEQADESLEGLVLKHTGYESIESLQQGDYLLEKDRVWQNYFGLAIFSGYQDDFFITVNKILLIVNLIDKLFPPAPLAVLSPEQHLPSLLRATVLLPAAVFPLPPYPIPAAATQLLSAGEVMPYAIGRLKMTRYRLLSYSLGEVAQIENVLKGERKKVVRRSLTHSGEQSVRHTHNANEQSNQSLERTQELAAEVQKTVAALTKKISYDKFTVTYGPPAQVVYDGSWKKEIIPDPANPGKEDTNSFASSVLNKTLSRIQESVLRSRTAYSFNEKEEIQSSLFDNHQGQQNFRGIYRWVNKVYRISLENYGYRFLLALRMDQPAAGFIASEQALNNINLVRPLSPQQQVPAINSFTDITPANYTGLLSYYQVTKTLVPPEPTLTTSITLNQSETEKYIPVPPGYGAATATVTGQIAAGASLTAITGIIGTTPFTVSNATPTSNTPLGGEINEVAVAVNGISMPATGPVHPSGFILVVAVTSKVSNNKMLEWQTAVYHEITNAYQQLMQQYNEAVTRFAREDQSTNPLLLNNIEKSSLYNNCMAMLLHIQEEKAGTQTANEQRYRQFMDRAMEWDEMTWQFDDQPARYSYALQGPGDSLRPFLQASQATVFLPVRPDHNFQVLYYLSAGVLWLPAYPFVPVNIIENGTTSDIAAHLKNIPHWHHRREEEKHWHITLPTAMQVIQEGTQLPDFITTKNESL